MSNSWGYTANFDEFLNRADAGSWISRSADAFGYAAANGRDGLGTVIVKSAGNDATNANGEGLNGARFITDVAALTQTGQITSYSNYGANILVSAGAASVTTDLLGSNGYATQSGTPGNYTTAFGGTSASAPLVTGVVALMLDANESLGWRDVREILATSAALTGSVVTGNRTFEVWGTTFQASTGSGDSWNDGGRAISLDYGFGRVDAYAAVRMAEVWGLFHDTPQTSANEMARSVASTGFHSFPTTNFLSLDVTEAMWIENVDVTITVPFLSLDVRTEVFDLMLHAPDGTEVELFSTRDLLLDQGQTNVTLSDFTWTFGVSQLLGLNALGTWSLYFSGTHSGANNLSNGVGDVRLDFYGREVDVDDVHHITRDFLLAARRDATGARDKIINDTNGGTDWINMSSIAGGVTATLDDLGRIALGRTLWATIAAGAAIENIVTGDGADKITGSALANEMHAMRGNDLVNGMAGNDDLYGGSGNDTVNGGADNDLVHGDTGADLLDGGLGNDTIWGGAGGDRINEGLLGGDDVVYGGLGQDRVTLGGGNDIFYDEAETGTAGRDTVMGGTFDDSLFGGGGSDSLSGDDGNDLVTGGEGNDTLSGGAGEDTLAADAGNDVLRGGNDSDLLSGGDGNDSLLGELGNDILLGDAGNDTLNGGIGVDDLIGGMGNDLLTGGADADNFVFMGSFDSDRVADFVDNVDTLVFDSDLFAGFADVVAFVDTYASVLSLGVVFDFLDGNQVTVSAARSVMIFYDDLNFA